MVYKRDEEKYIGKKREEVKTDTFGKISENEKEQNF